MHKAERDLQLQQRHLQGSCTRGEMMAHTERRAQAAKEEFNAVVTTQRLELMSEIVKNYKDLAEKLDAAAVVVAEMSNILVEHTHELGMLRAENASLEVRIDQLEHPWRTCWDRLVSWWTDFREERFHV